MQEKEGRMTMSELRAQVINLLQDAWELGYECGAKDISSARTVTLDAMTDAELAERGLVRLPVDADGVTIRVGDTLDGYGETTVVKRLRLGDDGLAMTCENGLWFDFAAFTHHHKPTVEDVLREFTDEVWNRCCEGATASDSGIDELVAECAAKLRLADDGKEQ